MKEDTTIAYYKSEIKRLIKYDLLNEYTQGDLDSKINEIKKNCEFETVIEALEHVLTYLEELKDKDKHNENRKKINFEKARDNFIKELEKNYHNVDIKIIKEIKFLDFPTKQDKLEIAKNKLYDFLINDCKTGKKRALEIKTILNFLKKTTIN